MKPSTRLVLGGSASCLCLGLASTANAVCMSSDSSLGFALPSISATEVSTAQVMQLVRQRQQEAQAAVVPSSALTPSAPSVPPAGQGAAQSPSSSLAANTPRPRVGPGAQKPDRTAAGEPPASPAVQEQAATPSAGTWAQGYGDYEHRSGLTIDVGRPGEISRNQWTGGFMVGGDRTIRLAPLSGVTLGVFGGYNETHAKDSTGVFRDQQGATTENFRRTDAKQDTEGGFAGGYAVYFHDRFALQTVFKADFYRVTQSDLIQAQFDNGGLCNLPATARRGKADLNNYITEVNGSYRFTISDTSWLEPILGFRSTFTNFSDREGDLGFGGNGNIFRIQGGARVGSIWQLEQGYLITTLTGLLYSDVAINGFSSAGGQFGPATPISDEGKLRVYGLFATRWDVGGGLSYDLQVEGRGGENLVGVGGRLGARLEW